MQRNREGIVSYVQIREATRLLKATFDDATGSLLFEDAHGYFYMCYANIFLLFVFLYDI